MTCRRRNRSASACGSSRVLMIGPAAGGGAADALPDVLGALAHAVRRAARRHHDLAGADDDLPGDQERDQDVGELAELPRAADEVVLVAAVGVAGGVGVVLEEVDVAGDALLVQARLGVEQQALEDPLPRLVVRDEVDDVVALGRGVLRVAADVEVEPRAVAEEDVGRAAPADDLAEEVAGDLVGAQPALALERARDAVLVLDAEDPPVHGPTLGPRTTSWRVTPLRNLPRLPRLRSWMSRRPTPVPTSAPTSGSTLGSSPGPSRSRPPWSPASPRPTCRCSAGRVRPAGRCTVGWGRSPGAPSVRSWPHPAALVEPENLDAAPYTLGPAAKAGIAVAFGAAVAGISRGGQTAGRVGRGRPHQAGRTPAASVDGRGGCGCLAGGERRRPAPDGSGRGVVHTLTGRP